MTRTISFAVVIVGLSFATVTTVSAQQSKSAAEDKARQDAVIHTAMADYQQSIEKLAPCVWLMQSLIQAWYFTEGHKLPEAKAARKKLGPWETEYSLRHMLRLLRHLTLCQANILKSPTKGDLQELVQRLENYLQLAA